MTNAQRQILVRRELNTIHTAANNLFDPDMEQLMKAKTQLISARSIAAEIKAGRIKPLSQELLDLMPKYAWTANCERVLAKNGLSRGATPHSLYFLAMFPRLVKKLRIIDEARTILQQSKTDFIAKSEMTLNILLDEITLKRLDYTEITAELRKYFKTVLDEQTARRTKGILAKALKEAKK